MTTPETQKEQGQNQPPVPGVPSGKRRKTKNKRRRKIIARIIWTCIFLAAVVGLVIAVKIVFYSPPPQYFNTDTVRRLDKLTQEITGWGYAMPVESLEVRSEVKGKVIGGFGYEGMQVQEGDLLCQIDGSEIDKAIETIQKEITDLESRIQKSNNTIATLTENMNKVNADQIAQAKEAILRAPFSGKIIEVSKETIGAPIPQGKQLGILVDDSVMVLRQYFSYGYINDIKTGMKAEVSIPASMSTLEGTVTNVEKVKNVQMDGTVTFEVEVSVDNPGALAKGMDASAVLSSAAGETILPADFGQLEYKREQVIYAGASGNIKEYNLRNFHEYREGDLLLEIEFVPDNSAIEGFLTSIENEENSIKELLLQIEEKNLLIEEQTALYDKLTITAPMSGMLLMYSAMFDQLVDYGTVICNIAQMERMTIKSNVDQSVLQDYSVGMNVEVFPGYDESMPGIPGVVRTISISGVNENGYISYPCTIEVDNREGRLRNDFGVSYKAKLSESINPLVASIDVIKPLIDGECVYVKLDEKPDNAIELPAGVVPEGFYAVPVTVGITSRILNTEKYMYESVVEITSGVEEGWVLYRQKLNVKPTPSPTPSDEDISEDDGMIIDDGMVVEDDGMIIDDGMLIEEGDMVVDDGMIIEEGAIEEGVIGESEEVSEEAEGSSDKEEKAESSSSSDVVVIAPGGVVAKPMPVPGRR